MEAGPQMEQQHGLGGAGGPGAAGAGAGAGPGLGAALVGEQALLHKHATSCPKPLLPRAVPGRVWLLLLAAMFLSSTWALRGPLLQLGGRRSRFCLGSTNAGPGTEAKSSAPATFFRDLLLIGANVVDTVEDITIHLKRNFAPGGVPGLLQAAQDALAAETSEGGVVKRGTKKRVVIAGSGWASHALIKIIDTDLFEVIMISPRPFFIFTPMLTSASVGTVEVRSIVEPIRAANPLVDFLEADLVDVDPTAQTVVARPKQDPSRSLSIEYDFLVYAAGATNNDFGTPGVREHCEFVKEVGDAKRIRSKILDNFERASIPSTSEAEVARLLTFAVVGGGPTGVEFCGELEDFVNSDLRALYPRLVSRVQVKLINSGSALLNAFDRVLQERALQALQKRGVDVTLNARVTKMEADCLQYTVKGGALPRTLDFGLCVWAAGTGPREITKKLGERLGADPDVFRQDGGRLRTDAWCRVASGPAETRIRQLEAEAQSEDGDGSEAFSGAPDSAGMGAGPARCAVKLGSCFAIGDCAAVVGGPDGPLPQSAQVAAQQGAFMARLLNRQYDLSAERGPEMPETVWKEDPVRAASLAVRGIAAAPAFRFLNLGLLAYVGSNEAVAQVELGLDVRASGSPAFILWRSVYLVKQVSTRTRFLVLFDFFKTFLFGRDLSGQ